MWRRFRDDESGQLIVLVLGFGVVILLLMTVVIGASKYFLYQRSLHSIADGAALAGTNGIDDDAIYRGGVGEQVELDPAAVEREVQEYVRVTRGFDVLRDFSCQTADVTTAGVVTVDCNGTVEMPFVNSITSGGSGGRIPVAVTASSQALTSG